jgi:hypothetical protein
MCPRRSSSERDVVEISYPIYRANFCVWRVRIAKSSVSERRGKRGSGESLLLGARRQHSDIEAVSFTTLASSSCRYKILCSGSMPSEVNVIVNEKHPTGQTASPQRVAAGPETTSYRQVTRKVAFLLIGFSTLLFVSLSFYITASSSSLNIRRVDANMALHNPFSRIATALAHENASVAFLSGDKARAEFLHHNSAQVVRTDAVIFQALHTQYPHTLITTIPVTSANLLEYATAGHAEANSVPNDLEHGGGGTAWDGQMAWKEYRPPARRLDNEEGGIFEKVIFGKYAYAWKGYEMIVYVVEVRESPNYYSPPLQYLVGGTDEVMTELIKEAGAWGNTLHNQIWVWVNSTSLPLWPN